MFGDSKAYTYAENVQYSCKSTLRDGEKDAIADRYIQVLNGVGLKVSYEDLKYTTLNGFDVGKVCELPISVYRRNRYDLDYSPQ